MVRGDHGDPPLHDDDEDDLPDDPGLNYPLDYVLMTWHEKNDHHLLPEAGGLNDQDWRLLYEDWPLVTRLYNQKTRELYPPEPKEGQETPYRSKIIPMPDPDEAGTFEDVLGE